VNRPAKPRRQVNVRMEPSLLRDLRYTAKRNDRTMGAEIRQALRRHLEDEQRRYTAENRQGTAA
jgi:hypothetical protein